MKTHYKISLATTLLFLLLGTAAIYISQWLASAEKQQISEPSYQAGNFQIQIKLNPEKAKVGNNQITIAIRDTNNQPVVDANIQAHVEMPAMGAMQAMRETISIANNDSGIYQGDYTLPMQGSWPLTLTIASAKQGNAKLVFAMSTSRSGIKLSQATPSKLSLQAATKNLAPQVQLSALTIDHYRRQLIGVTTTAVIRQNLVKTIHAGARVSYDQSRLTDITLKYDAWIGKLNANYLGQYIPKGAILFTVYSPELISAQDEYLASLKQGYRYNLSQAARLRLARWDISRTQIRALEKRGKAIEYIPIVAPVKGTIIEKNIVVGSAIKAGVRLLRLADLSTVWLEGEVYESELPWLKLGMKAQITLPERPKQSYSATVTFIDAMLNKDTRTAKIRVEIANADGSLRPDSYAVMKLKIDLGERLVIPEQAVIVAGDQHIVFVDKADDRLLPVKIKTGLRNNDLIEVLNGVTEGEIIVTSGNFLIAAESKLKAGLAQW